MLQASNEPGEFDADSLPTEAARRLRTLRAGVADAAAFTGGYAFRMIQLVDARRDASTRLAALKHLRAGDDHPEVKMLTAAIADADAERARIDERLAAHNATSAPRADLLRNVESWLRTTSARHGFAQATIQAKPQKGETVEAAVDRLRRRIRECDALRHQVESAIYPLSVAKHAAETFVKQRAVAPVTSSLLEFGGPLLDDGGRMIEEAVVFPRVMLKADVATAEARGIATGETIDVAALLCWLFPREMVARIVEDLKPDADDGNALTADERRTRLATIAQDRLMIEAEECELLFQSLAAGVVIEARRDCDPGAFLGLTLTDKPAEPAADDAMLRARKAQGTGQPINPDAIRFEGRA